MNKENTRRKKNTCENNKKFSYQRIQNWISAVVALITFGTLVVYIIVSVSQNDKTRESIALADSSLKLSQKSFESNKYLTKTDLRAYVLFENIRRIKFKPNEFPYLSVDVRNVGKTPARNMIIHLWLTKEVVDSEYFNYNKSFVENDSNVGAILGSNMSGNKDITGNRKISIQEFKDIMSRKINMSILGIIKYNDFFKQRHWTYFCMKYRPPSKSNFITYTNFNDAD